MVLLKRSRNGERKRPDMPGDPVNVTRGAALVWCVLSATVGALLMAVLLYVLLSYVGMPVVGSDCEPRGSVQPAVIDGP